MDAARDFCRGLRIIRQPTLGMSRHLHLFVDETGGAYPADLARVAHSDFGTRKMIDGTHVYTFPSAARLARTSEDELRACALGYRAKNLLATAQLVAAGEADLEDRGARLPDDELRARLCELPGVGAKVANCVMLFAYERLRAFPIDVWIERVLREKYFPRKRKPTARQAA